MFLDDYQTTTSSSGCRECWKSIAYSGNTTNLKQHLENNHPAVTLW